MTKNHMKTHAAIAALIAAVTALASCADETSEADTGPLTNAEAVPLVLEQTVGKRPTEMLQLVASNFYPTFETATALGGEVGESWDEARFKSELGTAFAPLSDQIDAAFAANIAAQMDDGEGQELLDLLAEGNNSAFALCIFDAEGPLLDNPFQTCMLTTGVEPSQKLQDGLGAIAGRMSQTIQTVPLVEVAVGYATCSALAKYGVEASTEDLSVDLGSTAIGLGEEKLPCTEYDTLAAQQLTGDINPNFSAESGE